MADAAAFMEAAGFCFTDLELIGRGSFGDVYKGIGEVIDEDVLHARVPFVARTQQCFAVKARIDGFLDIARRSFCDTSEAIHNLANKYREEFRLPNFKIPFNNRHGFYFNIPQMEIQGKLPNKFIQVMKHGNSIHCSTLDLASRGRSDDAEAEFIKLLGGLHVKSSMAELSKTDIGDEV